MSRKVSIQMRKEKKLVKCQPAFEILYPFLLLVIGRYISLINFFGKTLPNRKAVAFVQPVRDDSLVQLKLNYSSAAESRLGADTKADTTPLNLPSRAPVWYTNRET